MATCPALSTGDAFLSSLLLHIDCQAQVIGSTGYQSLASPGSFVSLALTGLLTLFVALFGLRLMMGETPTVRDGLTAVIKIGVVLTLAGSWPAYKTVVYDLIIEGPEQIAAAVAGPAALPGAGGDSALIARLQAADSAIIRLTNLGTGREPAATLPSSSGEQQRFPIADDPAFGWARVVFLTGIIAAFAVVRLTAGVLLALAPLFAGLLLFDLARGLLSGWARALVFTLLASVATALVLGVELAVLEPWLAQAVRMRQAATLAPSAPVELLVLSLGFVIALAGALAVLLRLSFMTHLPDVRLPMAWAAPAPSPTAMLSSHQPALPSAPLLDRSSVPTPSSRALVVADALRASQRREQAQANLVVSAPSRAPSVRATPNADPFSLPDVGQTLRRTKPRQSLAAALRDRRS
jgi:type IV secretion system protein VirB6